MPFSVEPSHKPGRVFLAVGRDAQRHDQAVLTEVHPVDQRRDEIEAIERCTLPGRELRRRAGPEAATDGALARAAAVHLRPERLQTPRILARGRTRRRLSSFS